MNTIKFVIAGQFPPPVNGFSFITQEMAKFIVGQYKTTIIDISAHKKRGGAGYHLHRLWLTLRGVIPLIKSAIPASSRIFYVAGESKLGLIYDILLCAVARALGYRIFVHHHNYNYIDSFSRPMAIFLLIIGQNATHIFLCSKMAEQFVARYKKQVMFKNSVQ